MHVTKIQQFQNKIFTYYAQKKRDLPWRKTTDPYSILVSEVMLQQTQVDRVIKYYTEWITTWPTINDLAKASRSEVLKKWLGLGYNSRAIRLHELAQKVSQQYQGDIIKALSQEKLPGIGPYTQHAIEIFSLNKEGVTVDTNIRRILMHEFNLSSTISDKDLETLAWQCLPKGKSRDWHNALMDYGATFLTAHKTGIKPKTTQSTFEGSDRQMRAQIVRYLLTKRKTLSYASLTHITKGISQERRAKILQKMIEEGILTQKKDKYMIKE